MPGNPLSDPNWAADVADTVERVVTNVREKTTNNVVLVARGVVYGVLAAFLGMTAFVLFLVGLTRGIQALLDLAVSPARSVYISYYIVGGIFCLVGWLLMRKRHARS